MVFVRVFDGKRKTYQYRKELKRLGFQFQGKPEACWIAEVSDEKVGEIEDWCFERRLEIETPYSKRSSNYRKAFFEACKPNFGKDRYLCVYCGMPVRKDRITVDHLVAVKRVQRSRYYLNLIRKWGCDGVNDIRNLVPCCKRCNSTKGTKAGIWVVRGLLGRSKWFLGVVWLVYLLMLLAGLGALVLAAPHLGGYVVKRPCG